MFANYNNSRKFTNYNIFTQILQSLLILHIFYMSIAPNNLTVEMLKLDLEQGIALIPYAS